MTVDAGCLGALGDLRGRHTEGRELPDHVGLLGGAQPGPVLVLCPLGDQPVDLGGVVGALVGHDQHRHGREVGVDGCQGAAVPVADPHLSLGGPYGDDRLQHADLADGGDQVLVRGGVVSDVDVDQQRSRVELRCGAQFLRHLCSFDVDN